VTYRVVRLAAVDLSGPNDAVRFRVWQRTEEDAVNDAEDCRRRSDSEAQRQHRDRGKRGRSSQLPYREDEVLSHLVAEVCAPSLSFDPLLLSAQRATGATQVAKLPAGSIARFDRGDAGFDQFRGNHVDVKRELVVDLAVDLLRGSAGESEESAESGNARHEVLGDLWFHSQCEGKSGMRAETCQYA
jgi:hypothetical protein